MRLLALDAALAQCSAALLQDVACLDLLTAGDSRAASGALPGLVQDLLRDHGPEFDAVAVTVGPGSFTGLRGSIALAHGLALGRGVPVIGVSVPEALLERAGPQPGLVWVAIDTRRAGRIFLARGQSIIAVPLDDLPLPPGPVTILGDAANQAAAVLRTRGAEAIASTIQSFTAIDTGRVSLRRLAGELPACEAQPLYIEPPLARPAASLRQAPA